MAITLPKIQFNVDSINDACAKGGPLPHDMTN